MRVHCEWGLAGARALAPGADVVVVIDVLSFSTCVDIACTSGARVFPFPAGDRAAALAEGARLGAEVAGRRSDPQARYTLSAPTLARLPAGARLLLPSPNGSAISHAAQGAPVLAGCLRNAAAVAAHAARIAGPAGRVALIPAGERWADGSLRPAIEDWLGAGAILSALDAEMSPEAELARAAFRAARPELARMLREATSGQELRGLGFPQDVEIAAQLDVSATVPALTGGAFAAAPP